VPDEEVTTQLNRLRAQAGNPSVRELAKLTERQGPGRAMSRSTVQDKLSGRNPARLWQILVLVQACADYANSIGAPLPAKDTDEQVWREWTQAASVRAPFPAPAGVTASPPPAPGGVAACPSPRWNLDPLIRAGLDDMVDLVQANEREPMADWLPPLAEALREAGMSNEQFLLAASKERSQDVVLTLLSLVYYQEERAATKLLFLCAVNQPAESIPIILALLRRKGEGGVGVELADRLVDTITGKLAGALPNTDPTRYVAIVGALRSATMEKDATRLLEGIGEHGGSDTTLQVAASFADTTSGDREKILSSAGKRGKYRLKYFFEELQNTAINGIEPKRTRDRIIFGIPLGEHAGIASHLKSAGLHEEADRVLELEGEPPF
jgi:hypothetical protein